MPRGMKPVKEVQQVEELQAPAAPVVPPAGYQTVQPPTLQPVVSRDRQVFTLSQVPSGFKGYPGVDYIEIRAFTLGELKYLSSGLTDAQVIEAFRQAIRNMDAAELSYQDFIFISSYINVVTSETQDWTMEITCRSCGKDFSFETGRDGLFQFEELSVPALPIVVEFNNVELHFDLPRLKDTLTAKELSKKFPKASEEIISLAAQVRNIPAVEAFKVLNNLTDPEDISLIEEIQKLLYHGALPISATCPECNYEGKYQVGQGVSTIKPFRTTGKSVGNRIKYGVAPKSE